MPNNAIDPETAETLDALDHVGKARLDDLAYRVAASAALGDTQALKKNVARLLEASPGFSVPEFMQSQPYAEEPYRQQLSGFLAAGFSAESEE